MSIMPSEFVRAIATAYCELNLEEFAEQILETRYRKNDVWQLEKFQLFQSAARALARVNTEHLDSILQWYENKT